MGTVIDLSAAESGGAFEPIPGGQYLLAITDGEVKESGPSAKNPGSLYIAWEFTVQEGEFENRKLWTNTSLLPQALFGLKNLVASCPKAGLDPNGQLDLDTLVPTLIGQDVVGVVALKTKPEAYQTFPGEKQNVIKGFKPAGDFKGSPGAANGPASLLP